MNDRAFEIAAGRVKRTSPRFPLEVKRIYGELSLAELWNLKTEPIKRGEPFLTYLGVVSVILCPGPDEITLTEDEHTANVYVFCSMEDDLSGFQFLGAAYRASHIKEFVNGECRLERKNILSFERICEIHANGVKFCHGKVNPETDEKGGRCVGSSKNARRGR